MNRLTVGATVALFLVPPPLATADDTDPPPAPAQQHNITYRARVDGIARGALISYRISDTQVNSANPTMLPGRTFETTAVLTDPKEAGMRISIQWPYSANLNCEILVDDQLVVQASQFISPRLTPAKDDPDFGAIVCGAPLSNAFGAPAAPAPADPAGTPVAPEAGPPGIVPPPADAPPPVPGAPPMPPAEGAPLDSPPPVPPAEFPPPDTNAPIT